MSEDVAVEKAKFLYSIAEAGASLGICKRMVGFYIARGELRTVRLGRRRMVHRDALSKFAARDHMGMPKGERK
jgi:excisionase family DNA binding protein